MAQDACSTMVVQGPVNLRKAESPVHGECTGCFFANHPCREAQEYASTRQLQCSVDNYIWEVESIGQ